MDTPLDRGRVGGLRPTIAKLILLSGGLLLHGLQRHELARPDQHARYVKHRRPRR
jgi:hypothetical protein